MEEHVLVMPTTLLHELGYFNGFQTDVNRYWQAISDPNNLSFRPRSAMEQDPSFKQLIPYVLLFSTDADGVESVFVYTRGTGQGEARLHRKRSVGIGGHISQGDEVAGDPYEQGMRRELDEEVEISASYSGTCVGLINDDDSEVGRVHLGIVHRFDLEAPAVHPRETDLVDAGFVRLDQVLGELDQFETWSSICLRHLFSDRLAD